MFFLLGHTENQQVVDYVINTTKEIKKPRLKDILTLLVIHVIEGLCSIQFIQILWKVEFSSLLW